MKCVLISILCLSTLLSANGTDEIDSEVPLSGLSLAAGLGIGEGESRHPGVNLAEGLTQVTGLAISLLLGVSALASWNYLRTNSALSSQAAHWFRFSSSSTHITPNLF